MGCVYVEHFVQKILFLQMALADLDNQRVIASAYVDVSLASPLLRYRRASSERPPKLSSLDGGLREVDQKFASFVLNFAILYDNYRD